MPKALDKLAYVGAFIDAGIGALAGSAVPGIGNIVGAVAGFAIGMFLYYLTINYDKTD